MVVAVEGLAGKHGDALAVAFRVNELADPAFCAEKFLIHLLERGGKFRLEQQVAHFSHDLLTRPTVKLLRAVIPVADVALHVADDDGVMAEVEQPGLFRQLLVGFDAQGDVVENNRHLAAVLAADPAGIGIEPTATHRFGFVDETDGFAGEGDLAVNFDPVAFDSGDEIEHPLAGRIDQASLLLEGRVHFQILIVQRLVARVEDHFDEAKSLVDRGEQRVIAVLALAQGLLRLLAFRNVAEENGESPAIVSADPKRIDVEPSVHPFHLVGHPYRFAR